ncbi:MAG: hypothetical protein KGL39_21230 [Patescibacteria group bacterium]|nr:hypothetical protein [Patescibacteria group bacterium]
MYKCPQCGATSNEPGNCPTCNVPMVEEAATTEVAGGTEEATEQTPSAEQAAQPDQPEQPAA